MGREGKEVDSHPVIVCRCRDITLEDVEKAIENGCTDIECLRKVLGIGFGPCQGRTCIPLVMRILSKKLGRRIDEIPLPTIRAPTVPIKIALFLKAKSGDSK